MMRFQIGRHKITLATESMFGLGIDIHWPQCWTEDNRRTRIYYARVWFGPWIITVNINEVEK